MIAGIIFSLERWEETMYGFENRVLCLNFKIFLVTKFAKLN